MTHVLVTGATGQVGGAVARALLQRGHQVRALVRDLTSDKAASLSEAGADLAQGDFRDTDACIAAAKGVDAVFVLTSPAAGIAAEVEDGISMVDAAAEAGVSHIVLSSVADAQSDTGIPHFESKYEIEKHLLSLDVAWTAVAPAFFYDNALFPWNVDALRSGVWRQPLAPDVGLKMIAVADIARFVVHVFEHPDRFADQHIDIAADELNGVQMAQALGEALGREVEYVEQDLEEVRDQFEDMAVMFSWFKESGFSAPIDELKAAYPEVPWTSFADWARAQDWDRISK